MLWRKNGGIWTVGRGDGADLTEAALRSWHLVIDRKTIPFKGIAGAGVPRNRVCGRN